MVFLVNSVHGIDASEKNVLKCYCCCLSVHGCFVFYIQGVSFVIAFLEKCFFGFFFVIVVS